MTKRKLFDRGMAVAFAAVALSVALGQPPPREPPEPGFTGSVSIDVDPILPWHGRLSGIPSNPGHDYVSPRLGADGGLAAAAIVTCPPPTKSTNATNPTGSDC